MATAAAAAAAVATPSFFDPIIVAVSSSSSRLPNRSLMTTMNNGPIFEMSNSDNDYDHHQAQQEMTSPPSNAPTTTTTTTTTTAATDMTRRTMKEDSASMTTTTTTTSNHHPPAAQPTITPTSHAKGVGRKRRAPPPPPPAPMMMNGGGGGEMTFHPDFMYCGDCTNCSSSPSSTTTTDTLWMGGDTAAAAAATTTTTTTVTEVEEGRLYHHKPNDGGSSEGLLSTTLELADQYFTKEKSNMNHRLVLESLLQPIAGVQNVTVHSNHNNNASHLSSSTNIRIQVCHDAQCQVDRLLRVLQQAGYTATVVNHHDDDDDDDDKDHDDTFSPTSTTTNNNNNNKDHSHRTTLSLVRSSFFVQGICCASEVPSIRRIVRPLPGVSSLQINITTKRVYVQHDPNLSTAVEIAQALSKQGFPATILHNGGGSNANGGATTTTTTTTTQTASQKSVVVGRTTLRIIDKELQEQDVAILQKHLTIVDGVNQVTVRVSERLVEVEHQVQVVSAAQLHQIIQSDAGYHQTVLVQDAQAGVTEQLNALVLSQPRSKYVDSTIQITNLTPRHVPVLTKAMRQQYIKAQVRAVHPHVTSRMVKVEHNPHLVTLDAICETLNKYGLQASVVTDGAEAKLLLPLVQDDDTNHSQQVREDNALSMMQQASQVSLFVILSGMFWVISLVAAVQEWERLEYAGLFSVLFGLPPVALKAWRTVRRCEFDANCMMVTAAVGALILGELDEAASVAFLFAISEYLEARATDKARTALAAICQLRPEHANVIHPETKEIVVIPADCVPVGSLLSVRTGDKIAADGIVVEGTSQIDESSLTGESVPVRKKINDVVSGGGINIGSTQLVIRTTTSVEDSAVSRLIRLVEEAQANQSPTEKMIDGFARAYTPAVLLVASFMCTVPWLWGVDEGRHWTLNGLIIIVIACPCALTISTPVTYAAGLAATAQRGIVVKGGASLEALGNVRTVLFDKTGTLTEGKFKILHLEEIRESSRSRKQMLELLAMMEAPSSHPVSATLVQAAKNEGVLVPQGKEVREHTILKGEGVTAVIDGKQVYVGNVRLFDRIGMFAQLSQSHKNMAKEWNAAGGSVGFIGVQGEGILGIFCVTDTVRPESKEVVESLLLDGVQVKMLTGDGEGAAYSVASQIGLLRDCVHAKLLPEDKLHYVEKLQQQDAASRNNASSSKQCSYGLFRRKKAVLFCGDGVNDAPALASAEVGVSMGEGASLAMEMSDVTLMDSNLHKLVYVIQMGRRVVSTIQENVLMSLACKLIVVSLTFLGYMTLLLAIASDVGVMLLVTLNGMKLLPGHTNGGLFSSSSSSSPGRRWRYRQVQSTEHSASSSSSIVSPDNSDVEDDDDTNDEAELV